MKDSMLGQQKLCSEELVKYFSQFPDYSLEEIKDLRYLADSLDELGNILLDVLENNLGKIQIIAQELNQRLDKANIQGWYNLPCEDLTLDEILFLLIYPFCHRMGGSFEARFATKGLLGKYLSLFIKKQSQ